MFYKLGMKHLGDKRAPVFLKMEGFSWFQGIPGFLQDKSKAEKGNQLKLEWMKVIVQVQFLLSVPVEPEKEVTDVWLATSFRAQNDAKSSEMLLIFRLDATLTKALLHIRSWQSKDSSSLSVMIANGLDSLR